MNKYYDVAAAIFGLLIAGVIVGAYASFWIFIAWLAYKLVMHIVK